MASSYEGDSFILQHFRSLSFLDKDSALRWTKKSMRFGSFLIYARGLTIKYGDDTRYWVWQKLAGDPVAEVAELIDITWLEVTGRMNMRWFTKGQKYAVMFIVQMTESAYSETVAIFSVNLPDGTRKDRPVDLTDLKQKQWVNIKVASFTGTGEDGNIEFSLRDNADGIKSGIVIAGVLIQPRV